MKKIILILVSMSLSVFAQEPISKKYDKAPTPVGGKADVDYIIACQMQYPPVLLKKKAKEEVDIYFTVDKDGNIVNPYFKNAYAAEFKTEAIRLLHFINYAPAKLSNVAIDSETSLHIKFSPQAYSKYCKSRGFTIPKDVAKYDTSSVIYDKVDVFPEYYKGEDALNMYVANNLEYPELAIKQGLQGTVLLQFIVEKNGTISNLTIAKEFNHFCTDEAIKTMRNTKWNPAQKNGKLVRSKAQYPVVFNLRNINKDNATSEQR